jgi:hypothetical protein
MLLAVIILRQPDLGRPVHERDRREDRGSLVPEGAPGT